MSLVASCVARWCLGDLTLAVLVLSAPVLGAALRADALEVERRHIAYARRRGYARQRRAAA